MLALLRHLVFFGRLMHKELGSGISDNPLYPYRSRKFTSSLDTVLTSGSWEGTADKRSTEGRNTSKKQPNSPKIGGNCGNAR